MMKNVDNETGEQAVSMNEPTERALQARTSGCKNFVCSCPFYHQLHCQDSARIHQFHSQIYTPRSVDACVGGSESFSGETTAGFRPLPGVQRRGTVHPSE